MENLTNVYVHHMSPFAIQFSESFGIRWYGLAYLAGFMICYFSAAYMARHGRILIDEQKVSDFVTYGAIGTLAGGRIGYAIFYAPELITQWGSSFPYWGVLEVHRGGMASHGGILGIVAACWLFSKVHKVAMLHIVDLACFAGGIAIFLGRVANFINGELYGRAVESPVSWAVKFPREIYRWAKNTPAKLESLGPVMEKLEPIKLRNGQTLDITASDWTTWIKNWDGWAQSRAYQYMEELLRQVDLGNQPIIDALAPVLTARHPSQLYQGVMEGLLISVVLFFVWKKPRVPGVIAGIFGIIYAIMRIIGEQFRMPDAHIGFELFGMTRGQWISVGFLLFAIGYLVVSLKVNHPKTGGWGEILRGKAKKAE